MGPRRPWWVPSPAGEENGACEGWEAEPEEGAYECPRREEPVGRGEVVAAVVVGLVDGVVRWQEWMMF